MAAHQVALKGVSGKKDSRARSEWMGFAGAAFLILSCVFYFKFTRQLSVAPAGYFLLMMPASWPLAVPAVRRLRRRGTLVGEVVWLVVIFSVYFWAAGGVMMVRTAYGQ
jgi:hypothetical protein